MFVFQGSVKSGEWEWKLVDETQGDASAYSNFEVGNGAKNSGGLRVRLTLAFTVSGLFAPLLITVSGLTAEELCPIKC